MRPRPGNSGNHTVITILNCISPLIIRVGNAGEHGVAVHHADKQPGLMDIYQGGTRFLRFACDLPSIDSGQPYSRISVWLVSFVLFVRFLRTDLEISGLLSLTCDCKFRSQEDRKLLNAFQFSRLLMRFQQATK